MTKPCPKPRAKPRRRRSKAKEPPMPYHSPIPQFLREGDDEVARFYRNKVFDPKEATKVEAYEEMVNASNDKYHAERLAREKAERVKEGYLFPWERPGEPDYRPPSDAKAEPTTDPKPDQ